MKVSHTTYIFLLFMTQFSVMAQVVHNNGAYINTQPGSFLHVNGTVLNNLGEIEVNNAIGSIPSEVYISEDIINNDILNTDGHIRLMGDWYNNSSFTSAMGTVFLQGHNQLISGSEESHFFNLTLDGTGYKTQEINAFSHGVLDLRHIELQTELFQFFVENANTDAVERTTGFVSSLNGGFLSRRTSESSPYLFPVGSSVGTLRYRPVIINPVAPNNTFVVRMANVDATSESFDRSLTDIDVCNLNPLYYHQINRSLGSGHVDLKIYYDELLDGSWGGISNWKQINNQWEYIQNSESVSANPLSFATSPDWNTFTDDPYILTHINETPFFDPIDPICQNANVPLLPTTSLNGYTGSWSASIDSSIVGIQNFTFTPDPNQCAFAVQIDVEVYGLPQINSVNEINSVQCFGDSALIEVNAIGVGDLQYQVASLPFSFNNQFLLPEGSFNFEVMDDNSCVTQQTFVISQPDQIAISSEIDNVLCANGFGSVDIDITGGVGPYEVLWDGTIYQEDLPSVVAGTYDAVITDDNGCEETYSAIVIETLSGEVAFIDNLTGSLVLDCNNSLISLEANGGYDYNWSGGFTPNIATNSFDTPGFYVVDYSDSNGCALQMDINITDDFSLPNITISNNTNSSNELTCSTPQIELQSFGGDSYNWLSGTFTGDMLIVDTPGIYDVVGIGTNGCSNSVSIEITSDIVLPDITIENLTGSDTLDCNYTSIDIIAGGGISYIWTWLDSLETTPNLTAYTEGMYYVEGVGDNGCTSIDSIYIDYLPDPTISVNSATICSGDSIVLIAQTDQPGGVYTWSSGLGNDSLVTVSPNSNLYYTVDYEGSNGCPSNTAISTIDVLPTPVASISGDDVICSTQMTTLNGSASSPGGTYQWLPTNETTETIDVGPMVDTDYGLIYTLNGCPSDTVIHSIQVIITPSITVDDESICEGDIGTLTAVPSESGGSYNWIPGNYTTSSISVSSDETIVFDVTYTLNGCTSVVESAQLIINEIPTITMDDIGLCSGDVGVLNAIPSSPGGTFSWNGFSETGSSLEVSPDITSSYTVSYELNDCFSSPVSANVIVTDQPTISVADVGVCIGETISITAVPSVPGGLMTWNPGGFNTETISITPTESIQYTVDYDLNGCFAETETVMVTVDTVPLVTFDVSSTSGCAPLNVVLTNTTENAFDCVWDIGGTSSVYECSDFSFNFIEEGCYDITLSMGTPNGCTSTTTMENIICVLPNPNVSFGVTTNQISVGSSEVGFTNTSSNAVDFTWDYGDGLVDSLVYNPGMHEFDIDDEEFFPVTLYGVSDEGCLDSAQVIIFVDQQAVVFAPNSFTPDNDGLNDSWFPTYSPSISEEGFEVQIFNRWGELIFDAVDFSNTWDGTFKGSQCQVGTYTYRISYKLQYSEEREVVIGHISLIR